MTRCITYSDVTESTEHTWGDTAKSWIERECTLVGLDLGFCLFGVEDGVSRILMVHSFGEFKI